MKMKGFTLIEIVITIAIICIIGGIIHTNSNNVSVGINGMVETRCINNLQFVIGEKGRVTQVLDTNGHGVSCTKSNI
jgi:prepilin-type N-terminal cleavage/methylation domain-containing protein